MRGVPLKGNKTTRCPGAFIVFDCESACHPSSTASHERQLFRLACCRFWRLEKGQVRSLSSATCTSPEDVHDFIRSRLSKHRHTWVVAHNLAVDMQWSKIFQLWEQGYFKPKYYVLNDSPVIVSGWIDGKRVSFVDSFNWWRCSLAKLGESVGCPKLTMPGPDASFASWETYCENDVDILYRAINQLTGWIRESDLGCMKYTVSGQAFACWRHRFKSHEVVPPASKLESMLARDAYYGTQCEPFHIGKYPAPVTVLDVNGAHASAMVNYQQPCRLIDYTRDASLKCLDRLKEGACATARVDVCTKWPLPLRVRGVGTIWATGRFCTTLCGDDLYSAWASGSIVNVHEFAYYQLAPLMRDFASYWWRKRTEYRRAGNKVYEDLAKLMPCCLYGKFGQKRSGWTPVMQVAEGIRWGAIRWYDCDRNLHYPGRIINGEVEIDKSRYYPGNIGFQSRNPANGKEYRVYQETEESFPAIAGWITSQVRSAMHRYIMIAGSENVPYLCHDSLHVNSAGYDLLAAAGCIQDGQLGKLKCVDRLEQVEYYGVNLYKANGKWKAAGLPGGYIEQPDGTILAPRWERMDTVITHPTDGTVNVRWDRWEPDEEYRHSRVRPDGSCVPWCLPMPEDYPPLSGR